MDKPELYIGIDPDVDKSGFAVWDGKEFTALTCMALYPLFEALSYYAERHNILVRLEAGWLEAKSNFNIRGRYGNKGVGERIAKNVGANHEIGKQIEKYCILKCIAYELVSPKGYSSYKHDYFCAITNWKTTHATNSEQRVAGMMVYGM